MKQASYAAIGLRSPGQQLQGRDIGNTGEYPEIVLPLLPKNEEGSWSRAHEKYKAGTLALTLREVRPAHELQFSATIDYGRVHRAGGVLFTVRHCQRPAHPCGNYSCYRNWRRL